MNVCRGRATAQRGVVNRGMPPLTSQTPTISYLATTTACLFVCFFVSTLSFDSVSYTHLTLPTIYSV